MTVLGVLLFAGAVLWMLYRYFRTPRAHSFPVFGYAGATILVAGELLMFAGVEPVATYFTSIAWTGYILLVDAAVFALRGRSLLKTYQAEFAFTDILSVPLWLIFEAYNLRLRNWIYVGVPPDWFAQTFGYAWAFSTIWPAIFETAAFIRATGSNGTRAQKESIAATTKGKPRVNGRRSAETISVFVGAIFITTPLVLPDAIRPYLFGFVWLGFIFLLEPVNLRTGAESLWRDLLQGRTSRALSLLWSGIVCGILWEFWNYWAHARWVYIFPMFQSWKIFAMPLPGFLGFPPFALECFAMMASVVMMTNRVLRAAGARWRFREEALAL
jgi:hypothetical protein